MKKKLTVVLSTLLLSLGILSANTPSSSAMCTLCFGLSASNPAYSNPYAQQYIMGEAKNAYIKVTATKSGYANKYSDKSWTYFGPSGYSYVEVYGPTFASAGTTFYGYGYGTHPTQGYKSYSNSIRY